MSSFEVINESLGDREIYSEAEKTSWDLIHTYFAEKGYVKSQINSFNELLYKFIPEVIQRLGTFSFTYNDLKYTYTFKNPIFNLPCDNESDTSIRYITPSECRIRNMTYQAAVYCDFEEHIMNLTTKISKTLTEKLRICHIPLMLKSELCVLKNRTEREMAEMGECMYDHGGYFIVNGGEKVFISQERMAHNQVFCYQGKKGDFTSELRSVPEGVSKAATQVVVRYTQTRSSKLLPTSLLSVSLHCIKKEIPLIIVFRALGILDNEEIIRFITLKRDERILKMLEASFEEANMITDTVSALRYIGSNSMLSLQNAEKQIEYARTTVLSREMFPHIGNDITSDRLKAFLLGHMVYKCLLTSLGDRDVDDRDHFGNKRMDLSGNLIGNIFRIAFTRAMKDFRKPIEKNIQTGKSKVNYKIAFDSSGITKTIRISIATGNWGNNSSSKSSRTGVTQPLHRLTYISTLSNLRRVVAPIAKEGKLPKPRQLHNSLWSRVCVTGDTQVVCINNELKFIKDLVDGDVVVTVNPQTLEKCYSRIKDWFKKQPEKLLEVTTISGRKLKCTDNHPLLIHDPKTKQNIWKRADQCESGELVIVNHLLNKKMFIDEDEKHKEVLIMYDDFLKFTKGKVQYTNELLELGFLNQNIDQNQLATLARLYGLIMTDGHLGGNLEDMNSMYVEFFVGEQQDVFQVINDLNFLGFNNANFKETTSFITDNKTNNVCKHHIWSIKKSGSFAALMFYLGCTIGAKCTQEKIIPDWIKYGSKLIKRNYLNGMISGDGSTISFQKNKNTWKRNINNFTMTCDETMLENSVNYLQAIVNIFNELGVKCHQYTYPKSEDNKKYLSIVFNSDLDSSYNFIQIVDYVYSYHKKRRSRVGIEQILFAKHQANKNVQKYDLIAKLKNEGKTITEISNFVECTKSQIQKVLNKNKNNVAIKPRGNLTIGQSYLEFASNVLKEDFIAVPIDQIIEIEKELVYDFTTENENHSFIGNGIVQHNCSHETPEGNAVGLIKNLSMMSEITVDTPSAPVKDLIEAENLDKVEDFKQGTKVFVNGICMGTTDEPLRLFYKMKEWKMNGLIQYDTSIVHNPYENEINVMTDGGRCIRPLLFVHNREPFEYYNELRGALVQTSWNQLCRQKLIEYVDGKEEEYIMCAMNFTEWKNNNFGYSYTHMEIHPSMIMGVCASTIPLPDHNQAPRNTYQSSQVKQALGVYTLNYKNRFDTQSHLLWYPQKPLITTKMGEMLKINDMPAGQQCIVAIACHTGLTHG